MDSSEENRAARERERSKAVQEVMRAEDCVRRIEEALDAGDEQEARHWIGVARSSLQDAIPMVRYQAACEQGSYGYREPPEDLVKPDQVTRGFIRLEHDPQTGETKAILQWDGFGGFTHVLEWDATDNPLEDVEMFFGEWQSEVCMSPERREMLKNFRRQDGLP